MKRVAIRDSFSLHQRKCFIKRLAGQSEGQMFVSVSAPWRQLQVEVFADSDYRERSVFALQFKAQNVDIEIYAWCYLVDVKYQVINGSHISPRVGRTLALGDHATAPGKAS